MSRGWFARDPRRPLSSGDRRLLLHLFRNGDITLREWSRLGDDLARRRLYKRAYVFYIGLSARGGRALEEDPIGRKAMDSE